MSYSFNNGTKNRGIAECPDVDESCQSYQEEYFPELENYHPVETFNIYNSIVDIKDFFRKLNLSKSAKLNPRQDDNTYHKNSLSSLVNTVYDMIREYEEKQLQLSKKPDPLEEISKIQKQAENILQSIEEFTGFKHDREYISIDETLLKMMMNLDDINTEGKENVRGERKKVLIHIQDIIRVLEEKAEENQQKVDIQEIKEETVTGSVKYYSGDNDDDKNTKEKEDELNNNDGDNSSVGNNNSTESPETETNDLINTTEYSSSTQNKDNDYRGEPIAENQSETQEMRKPANWCGTVIPSLDEPIEHSENLQNNCPVAKLNEINYESIAENQGETREMRKPANWCGTVIPPLDEPIEHSENLQNSCPVVKVIPQISDNIDKKLGLENHDETEENKIITDPIDKNDPIKNESNLLISNESTNENIKENGSAEKSTPENQDETKETDDLNDTTETIDTDDVKNRPSSVADNENIEGFKQNGSAEKSTPENHDETKETDDLNDTTETIDTDDIKKRPSSVADNENIENVKQNDTAEKSTPENKDEIKETDDLNYKTETFNTDDVKNRPSSFADNENIENVKQNVSAEKSTSENQDEIKETDDLNDKTETFNTDDVKNISSFADNENIENIKQNVSAEKSTPENQDETKETDNLNDTTETIDTDNVKNRPSSFADNENIENVKQNVSAEKSTPENKDETKETGDLNDTTETFNTDDVKNRPSSFADNVNIENVKQNVSAKKSTPENKDETKETGDLNDKTATINPNGAIKSASPLINYDNTEGYLKISDNNRPKPQKSKTINKTIDFINNESSNNENTKKLDNNSNKSSIESEEENSMGYVVVKNNK